MAVNTSKKSVFVRRLGRHHFAHLRAFSEGLDVQASAKRYLGIEHGHEAKTGSMPFCVELDITGSDGLARRIRAKRRAPADCWANV